MVDAELIAALDALSFSDPWLGERTAYASARLGEQQYEMAHDAFNEVVWRLYLTGDESYAAHRLLGEELRRRRRPPNPVFMSAPSRYGHLMG